MAQRCLWEMGDNIAKGRKLSRWEKERRQFFEIREVNLRELIREKGVINVEELEKRDKELQKVER